MHTFVGAVIRGESTWTASAHCVLSASSGGKVMRQSSPAAVHMANDASEDCAAPQGGSAVDREEKACSNELGGLCQAQDVISLSSAAATQAVKGDALVLAKQF